MSSENNGGLKDRPAYFIRHHCDSCFFSDNIWTQSCN